MQNQLILWGRGKFTPLVTTTTKLPNLPKRSGNGYKAISKVLGLHRSKKTVCKLFVNTTNGKDLKQ